MASKRQKLYVIQHELGPVKIGIAENPRQRLISIQVGSPYELELKKVANPESARQAEEYLHNRFQKYRMRGEWFDIPPERRDFEIPTQFTKDGEPNVTNEYQTERDIDNEWADIFDRTVRAMEKTKYRTPKLDDLQKIWRVELANDDETDTNSESERGEIDAGDPTLHEVEEDVPEEQVRCASCGHHYHRSEQACPVCGVDDASDAEHY